ASAVRYSRLAVFFGASCVCAKPRVATIGRAAAALAVARKLRLLCFLDMVANPSLSHRPAYPEYCAYPVKEEFARLASAKSKMSIPGCGRPCSQAAVPAPLVAVLRWCRGPA